MGRVRTTARVPRGSFKSRPRVFTLFAVYLYFPLYGGLFYLTLLSSLIFFPPPLFYFFFPFPPPPPRFLSFGWLSLQFPSVVAIKFRDPSIALFRCSLAPLPATVTRVSLSFQPGARVPFCQARFRLEPRGI